MQLPVLAHVYLTLFALILSAKSCSSSISMSPDPQDHRTYLTTVANGSLTLFDSSVSTEVDRIINKTPCTVLYTYARWNAHAVHLIRKTDLLQRIASQYAPQIEQGCLQVAITEINEPLEEGHRLEHLIREGWYWGSLGILSQSQGIPRFVDPSEWDRLKATIDRCLSLECSSLVERASKAEMAHGEL